MLGDLGAQVGQVDVARLVARHDHHAHAGHHRAGGVGAVRRRRDQAHVAGALAVGEVVAADGQQAGELALRPGVGLQRNGVVAGDLGERVLELGHELPVAGRLLGRDEGVDRRELGPADGLHLGRGVQLHGARAERDHGPVERQVAVGEPAEVAQQRGLGAVLVEDRVGEERRGAPPLGSQAVGRGDGGVEGRHVDVVDAQGRAHRHDVVARGGLVARDPHGVGIDATEVHPTGHGGGEDGIGPSRHPHGHRVEERPVHHLEARATGRRGHDAGEAVGALGDGREAVGAVVHRVHAGDDGEQHLGGADVRRGLLAADVLLTGLQRQPVRDGPVGVARGADEPTGQRALEPGAHGHEAGVGPAEAERDAEALRRPDGHVGPPGAGRREQGEREQVGGGHDEGAPGVGLVDQRLRIGDGPGRRRVRQQQPEHVALGQAGPEVGHDHPQPERLGPGLDHGDGLRVGVGVDHERGAGRGLGRTARQRERLGRGGGLVEQRGVRQGQARQVGDHGLEVQQRLEPALRDLGLVRRVGGVPGGALEDVATDHRRRVGAVVAEADHRGDDGVRRREPTQVGERLLLGAGGGELQRGAPGDGRGHRVGDEVVERRVAQRGQHLGLVVGCRADVAPGEGQVPLELVEGAGLGHDGTPGKGGRGKVAPSSVIGPESFASGGPGTCTFGETGGPACFPELPHPCGTGA